MKSKIICLILVLAISFSTIITATTITDVPKNHWAYEDVKFSIDKGLLELFEDGSFRGSDTVTRYQLAAIIARLLKEIERGTISLSQQDMQVLRELTVEFQEELVDLAIKGEVFSEQIKVLEEKILIHDEDITDIIGTDIAGIREDINKLNERINNTESDVSSIIDSIIKLGLLEERIMQIEKQNLETQKQIADLREINLEITDDTIQGLSDRITINATRLNLLQDEISNLKAELENKNREIERLEVENSNYKTYLYGVGAVSLILLLLSS
jgi:chromosome segregation ATPase